ncbi:FAD:protein FMN transferase [Sessilibacter sp. MAH1]
MRTFFLTTSVVKQTSSNHGVGLVYRALLCFVLVGFISACSDSNVPLYLSGPTMGTTYNITIIDDELSTDPNTVAMKIMNLLGDINQAASTYIKDSELMRFNRSPIGEPVVLSSELTEILQVSSDVYQLTHGAFDVTVAPLVNIWGFGPDNRREVPSDLEISDALAKVGFEKILLDATNSTATRNSDVSVDLSSVAKGYAVDKVANYLEMLGVENYLVEIGGEIRVKGHNNRGSRWRIGIEAPTLGRNDPAQAIEVEDLAMATSGDYRNYFDDDGVRYSHTIDPRTGKPITHNLASITVLHKSSAMADALATGLNVLGYEKSIKVCNDNQIPCFFIVREHDKFAEYPSETFEQYMN